MSDKKITDWAGKDGEFKRQVSSFRDWVSTEEGAKFPAEKDRYHLYVSYACPWAHRALIVRKLKGLEDIITFSSVHWHMGEKGWRFATKDEDVPGENTIPDPLHSDFTHIRQVYFESEPEYKDRFTVPVLYDKKQKRIVNNESADIIRMLYTTFDGLVDQKYKDVVLLPKDLEKGIDETNDYVYNDINNGVYKSGFATTQDAYEKAVTQLFKSLAKVESHLESQSSKGPYFWGKDITESDVRLYTTIIRFDPVYVQHFKCNLKDIRSGFPYLHKWVRHLYWDVPAFKDTTEFTHIKSHVSIGSSTRRISVQ